VGGSDPISAASCLDAGLPSVADRTTLALACFLMRTLIRKTFSVPPLGCNCSIIGDPVTQQAIVVDPGGAAERILREVRALGLTVTRILHTHAHFDHFLASGEMKNATGAALCLHKDDRELWDMLEMQCRAFGVPYLPVPPPDYWLTDEEKVSIGHVTAIALHTPGHTPGSMSFHVPEGGVVLAGDTLFRGSIGRTDLWGGDFDAIERSIRDRLYTLDDSTLVVTGHGPETEIGWEKQRNQFVRA
jgi:hydroxyacylglutathione hydrolase